MDGHHFTRGANGMEEAPLRVNPFDKTQVESISGKQTDLLNEIFSGASVDCKFFFRP
jgi:hypothetical protein